MGLGQQVGFEFPIHEFDRGIPGRYYASHAEAQSAALAPNQPMGVSNMMCSTCQDFLSVLAQNRNNIQVVADPYVTRIFYPNGRIRTVR